MMDKGTRDRSVMERTIISKHWVRRTARDSYHLCASALRTRDGSKDPSEMRAAMHRLDRLGIPRHAVAVEVEHAGRVRARWVVVAYS